MNSATPLRQQGFSGPLDSRLRPLTGKAWDVGNTPLAVKRFVRELGMDCPSTAMKMATDLLLSTYHSHIDEDSVPITVEKLCDICGATLTGIRPNPRNATVYSLDSWQSRQGHTGKLSFDDSRVSINIPEAVDYLTARLSVAHELGHLLIHRRGKSPTKQLSDCAQVRKKKHLRNTQRGCSLFRRAYARQLRRLISPSMPLLKRIACGSQSILSSPGSVTLMLP